MYSDSPVTSREAWNRLVVTIPDRHLHQSHEWGESQRHSVWTPYRVAVLDGNRCGALTTVLARRLPVGVLMYAPHGPLLADPVAAGPLLGTIRKLARATGAITFRASPPSSTYEVLLKEGFCQLPEQATIWNSPRINVVLDISGTLDDLRHRMRKKTRQYLERAAKNGVQFEASLDCARPSRTLALRAPTSTARLRPLGLF